MSDFIMTMSDNSEHASSSESENDQQESGGFSFDFNDDGITQMLSGQKSHAWNFDHARAGLRDRETKRKTVDDIISQKRKEKSAASKSKMEVDESSGSESNESSIEDENESSSVSSSGESESQESDHENSGSESGSSAESDEEDIDAENGFDGSISSEEEDDEDDGMEDEDEEGKPKTEIQSIQELRDITRKGTKKQMELLDQFNKLSSFEALKLSRPLLKSLQEFGFSKPTPVQINCIPVALKGKDICASAITGSGKTAAFILPVLERLLYRNSSQRATRVLILTPTRELAVQCHSVILNLAKYTNGITAALVTGGMATKKQEVDLRAIPDIIVATPGRVLDHLLNTRTFGLDDIEILILDEADRLLEMGFVEQLEQIVKACPTKRQTLLFSATMTHKVDQLASLSLNNPAKLSIDPLFQVAKKLSQEFVRVRSGMESDKEAILLSLCTRTFKSKVIIFCTHKVTAHRLKIIFTLAGLNAVELHGDLTQEQRFDSLESFRDGKADFMIASDVASRGLDVIGINTVINYELPLHLSSYVHRVGRTARAGRSGRAVSLVTEQDRRLFKLVVKNSHDTVKQRVVPPEILSKWKEKLSKDFVPLIESVLKEEAEDKMLRKAEMEANRMSNLIEHRDEIMSRPKKTWFQNEAQKKAIKEESKRVHLGQSKFEIKEDTDLDDESKTKSKKQMKREEKENQKNDKKRKREEMENSTRYNIFIESKSAKKRKLTDEDQRDLKSQKVLIRQRKRERRGTDGNAERPSSSTSNGHSSSSASLPSSLSLPKKKTSNIKLKNKQSSKKGDKDSSLSSGKKERRDKGPTRFGSELKSAGQSKKSSKGGSFKSKKRHKRH